MPCIRRLDCVVGVRRDAIFDISDRGFDPLEPLLSLPLHNWHNFPNVKIKFLLDPYSDKSQNSSSS